jgi:hypothetical protein
MFAEVFSLTYHDAIVRHVTVLLDDLQKRRK